MGKKRKLNRLISRWIRSDLPEDRSTVLLLGVTRIPTSPTPARRPCSLPLTAPPTDSRPPLANGRRRNSNSSLRKRNIASRTSFKQAKSKSSHPVPQSDSPKVIVSSYETLGDVVRTGERETPPSSDSNGDSSNAVMDRSVDSIGTCSLDVDASVESSDWSEATSHGTLKSASILTTPPEPRLPSYLSLACTVNGYSTTTNYDPERLARSRDNSPHRPNEHAHQDHLTATYTVHNNLLSPPNLVPLPIYNNTIGLHKNTKHNMSNNTMATTHHRREFYSSNNTTTTIVSSESKNISSTIYSSDTIDSCLENGLRNTARKSMKFEASVLTSNGSCPSEQLIEQYSSAQEKSVIQQRVERLYGPGFLAQGFLLMKRQKNKSCDADTLERDLKSAPEKHSISAQEHLLRDEQFDGGMKQSTSSPTLPVFRHLRPEFRAQLPIVKAKKPNESNMQKSVTVPTLVEGVKVNGRGSNDLEKESCDSKNIVLNGNASINGKTIINGTQDVCDKARCDTDSKDIVTKDGHHFISILEKEAERLLALADQAEQELEQPNLPEDAKGYLRSAAGKAKLLVSQKMQQFRGLCTNNIKQVEGDAFPTTNEDLQGFWDMIMLQVDQIDALFKELDTLRAHNWQEQKPIPTTNGANVKSKKVTKPIRPTTASAEENRRIREAQRKKMLEERRRAMKEQQNHPSRQSIEIFVPESS